MRVLEIIHYSDDQGNKLCSVPLTNSDLKVTLHEDDLDLLLSMKLPLIWKLSQKQVTLIGRKTKESYIARRLLKCGPKDRIRYKDGDGCNLRRENLLLTTSRGIAATDNILVTHILQ
jgi:hypothetical protein